MILPMLFVAPLVDNEVIVEDVSIFVVVTVDFSPVDVSIEFPTSVDHSTSGTVNSHMVE